MLIIYEKSNEVKQMVITDKKILEKELTKLLNDKEIRKISIDKKEFWKC